MLAAASFALEPSSQPVAEEERARLIADPGFGRVFTDHMAIVRYSEDRGWHDARIVPRQPLEMHVTSSVLHYAQEIFEGLKAYRRPNGSAALFRPRDNALRFQASARRMAMPGAAGRPVSGSRSAGWCAPTSAGSRPGRDAALYLRPFMIASESFLGVRPAAEYLYAVVACAVGPYFKGERLRSRCGRRAIISGRPPAAPAPPNAAGITPRA
jgi:branched-chain amino acid aminotransferase